MLFSVVALANIGLINVAYTSIMVLEPYVIIHNTCIFFKFEN
jgi:hypothetical protein